MSAVTDESNKDKLPPEVWEHIFEFATDIPGIVDTNVDDPFDVPHAFYPIDRHDQQELALSLPNKLSLMLVCKNFYYLVIPMLYRAVAIRDGAALTVFHRTLTQSCNSPTAHQFPISSWVRRMDFMAMLPSTMYNYVYTMRQVAQMIDIFGCLPCLEILTMRVDPESKVQFFPREWTDALLATCGPSLRILRIDQCLRPRVEDSALILRNCPNLRCFYITRTRLHHYDSIEGEGVQDFLEHPGLRLLSMPRFNSPGFKPGILNPLLRQVHIHLKFNLGCHRSTDATTQFLQLQGPYITTAYVELDDSCVDLLKVCMVILSQHCPSLIHLIFISADTSIRLPHSFPFTLTHIGIYSHHSRRPLPVVTAILFHGVKGMIYQGAQYKDTPAPVFRLLNRSANMEASEEIFEGLARSLNNEKESYNNLARRLLESESNIVFRVEDWEGKSLLVSKDVQVGLGVPSGSKLAV